MSFLSAQPSVTDSPILKALNEEYTTTGLS